jgi:type II secretory pathway component PulF
MTAFLRFAREQAAFVCETAVAIVFVAIAGPVLRAFDEMFNTIGLARPPLTAFVFDGRTRLALGAIGVAIFVHGAARALGPRDGRIRRIHPALVLATALVVGAVVAAVFLPLVGLSRRL